MIRLSLILTTLLLATSSHPPCPKIQDVKVATWTLGTPETDNFESLAFWVESDKRAYIRYLHGKSTDDTELRWLGPDSIAGRRGFKAGFPSPDNRTFFITPVSDTLLVITRNRTAKFLWADENADSASSCNICASSAKQAAAWLRRYFWN